MLKVIIKVELIPVNMELAVLRSEIKETENRIEKRLTRLETLIEAQSRNQN
ncbi:MAG: hypothetical protein AB4062_02945 [Crocosphaera sp.]